MDKNVSARAFEEIENSQFTDVFILSTEDGIAAIRCGCADMLIYSAFRTTCILFHNRAVGNEVRIAQLKKYCPEMIWEKGAY